MQITIVQSEIEQAIRNYISSRLMVAEGMEMTIDLSATRGVEGFKATIDIHPVAEGGAKVTAAPLHVPKPAIFTPPTTTTRAPAPEPETVKEEAAPFAPEEAPAAEVQASEELPPKEVKEPSEGNGEVKTDAPAAASGGRSLFKGLAKPKNN